MNKQNKLAPFHVMIQPIGALCNLDCYYCYYLSKEKLYPQNKSGMPIQLLELYTAQYMNAQSGPEITFAWQGGEPMLLGIEFFEHALRFQQKYKPDGMRIINTIQTNGTLIDDAWCLFFKENHFLIGISIDGPQPIHDTYRRDKAGNPTFHHVMKGISLLNKHKVEFNTLTTLHAANAPYPEQVYNFLRNEASSHFMQFIPIVERIKSKDNANSNNFDTVTDRSITPTQYGTFLMSLFDKWVKQDVGRIFVQFFDVALAASAGYPPGLCVFAETCGHALALEHNGDLYSCDHYVDPKYKLGNITDKELPSLVNSQSQERFGKNKKTKLPRYCLKCEYLSLCNGGCPKDRFIKTPDGEHGLNYLCEGYKAFFKHIQKPMQIMVDLLKQRRPPAEIMFMS